MRELSGPRLETFARDNEPLPPLGDQGFEHLNGGPQRVARRSNHNVFGIMRRRGKIGSRGERRRKFTVAQIAWIVARTFSLCHFGGISPPQTRD